MARLNKEQRKERRKQRRIKRALRSYRFRTLKNFFIWLSGVFSCILITVGVVALCLAVIPISTFTGGEKNEYVSEKVANNTLLNVIMNIGDYDMSDIPIVADSLEEMIKNAGIDEYVEIDTAKMKTLKFDANFTNELTSCIKVVATLESVGGLELLGDIGKLNVFTEWEEIEVIADDPSTPDVDESESSLMPVLDSDGNIAKGEGENGALKSNPKMYYYKVESGSTGGGAPYSEEVDNSKYERAFDDDGKKVAGYNGTALYFPAVAKISILDAVQVLGESFGRVQIVNLLENFGAEQLTDSMIGKVLDGKRIRDMADINAEGILLADVLNYNLGEGAENDDSIKQLFDILIQAVESEEELTPSNLTVGHLTSGFNVGGINLNVVLKEESNADLYKILRSAVGLGETDAITIDSLSGLNPQNIALESVLKRDDNAKLYEILDSAITPADKDKGITVGDLGSLNPDGISLEVVMKKVDNPDLYAILESAVTISNPDKGITIGDLKTIKTDDIALESVLKRDSNAKLYEILDSVIEPTDKDKGITIGDLGKLNDESLNNLSLGVVMPESSNPDLYKILRDATGVTDGDITIADLKNIGAEFNIKISTVMTLEDSLMTMICEAVNAYRIENVKAGQSPATVDKYTITIKDLADLKPDYIKLTSVLSCEGNETLYKVLLDSAGIPWTDSNLSTQASGLTIKDIKFNTDNVKISSVMMGMNDDTLTLIREAVNAKYPDNQVAGNSDLTIGHLTKIDPNYIKLNSVLPCKGNEMLYKILIESKGETWTEGNLANKAAEITVKDIVIKTENVKILTVMPSMNEDTLDIIRDSVNTANAGTAGFTKLTDNTQLTIGHISDFSIDCIKLTSVIDFKEGDATNVKMWKLLLEGSGKDITGKSNSELKALANGMTVNDLDINIDDVKLTTVMPYVESDNGVMYDMLVEATSTPIDKLTMATLSGKIDVNKVHLAKVMPSADAHLKAILADAFNSLYNPSGTLTSDDVFAKITIGDLGTNFSVDSIRLETVVENPPEDLVALMEEMMNDDYSNITVSALSSFELTNVSLKTVVKPNAQGTTGNQILDALIAKDVKIGGLGSSINDLSLYDIYGKGCFVKLSDVNNDTTQIVDMNYKFRFDENQNAFIHDTTISDEEAYFIHKDDGIWLLLCFKGESFEDTAGVDTDGRPEKYVISKFTVENLGEATTIKDVLTNARMQQFIDAGIFADAAVKQEFKTLPLSLIINPPSSLS